MTNVPEPASAPWLNRRTRVVRVPGFSDEYHERICLTRSVTAMGHSLALQGQFEGSAGADSASQGRTQALIRRASLYPSRGWGTNAEEPCEPIFTRPPPRQHPRASASR